MENYQGGTWGPIQGEHEFSRSMNDALQRVSPGIFYSDNLVTWLRNLSFLDDAKFMGAFRKNAKTEMELGIIWRTHVYAWCAKQALRRSGDFVECGCYKGTSVRIVCDYIDFGQSNKQFYIYDLFNHTKEMPHHKMPEHGPGLFGEVCERFNDIPSVKVVQGHLPSVLSNVAPSSIALLHLDLNNAAAEVGALDILFDKMTTGGIILLDDYGWSFYREQKLAEDKFFASRGLDVMELPTGQGLVFV